MNAPYKLPLPDVQSSADNRQLAIQRVGVKGLRYPLTIAAGANEVVATVATIDMTVGLPPDVKGTHMSCGSIRRFVGSGHTPGSASPSRSSLAWPTGIRR